MGEILPTTRRDHVNKIPTIQHEPEKPYLTLRVIHALKWDSLHLLQSYR